MSNNMLKLLNKTINKLIKEQVLNKTDDAESAVDDLLSNMKTYVNESTTVIAKELNVAKGTVTRWLDLKNAPEQYRFELMKMLGEDIDYSQFTAKSKDQFFTSKQTAKYCFDRFIEKMTFLGEDLSRYTYIEPSAGDGSFLEVLPSDRTIAVDIEPRHDSIIKADYLEWQPPEGNDYIVFGNPPFGLRGHLALKFINHSYDFADYVVFILPQLFESDGKGSPRKRLDNYNLIHSEKLNTMFHYPSGDEVRVNVVFQIWSKHRTNKQYEIKEYDNNLVTVYSLSNGNDPSQQRNVKMIGKCDFYLPSTCFGIEKMTSYDTFEELPGKKGYGIVLSDKARTRLQDVRNIDWQQAAFLSTNSAVNLRTSKIKENIINLLDK